MKVKALAIAILLTLSHIAVAFVQQAEPQKARIEGMVVRAGTNEPITGIRLTLTRAGAAAGGTGGVTIMSFAASTSGPPPTIPATAPPARGNASPLPAPPPTPPPPPSIPSVVTDREGKFVIPDLDAGSYRLAVAGSGYVKQEYGQRVFPGQGTTLTLTAGQVMKDIVMKLTLTGNVSGRLRDTNGQPVVGVPIQILKPSYNFQGQKAFQSAGSTRTNDRGEYRLYWVTPGRYILAAGSSPGPTGGPLTIGGPAVSPNDPNDSYTMSYFPGVTDVAIAQTVDVTAGNEATADFLVSRQQTYSIKGRVVDSATNQPPPSINVSMSFSNMTGGGGTFSMNTPYNPTTGQFEVRDVVPASYTLAVASGSMRTRVPLTVTNNIDGLNLSLGGTVSVPGRVTIDGQLDLAGIERVRVQLLAVASALGSPGSTTVAADGTFRFDQVMPGEYRVSLVLLQGAEYFLKDAKFDRNDALNQPLVVSDATQGGSLDIVISHNPGQIDGVVSDDKLQPMAGVLAVLIPDRNRDRTELFKSTTTDQTGHFTLRSIPAGDYKLFAWEALENFAYFDPDLLRQVESQGKPVHVNESSKLQVDVKVIPAAK